MERLNLRRLIPVAVLCAGALAVAGCGEDYDGNGNEFLIGAKIEHVGEHSVDVDHITVESAHGKATAWFEKSAEHQIHNNYRSCSWGLDMHTVGQVVDSEGQKIDLDEVHKGDTVEIQGKIRDSHSSCGKYSHYDDRPVFDKLTDLGKR